VVLTLVWFGLVLLTFYATLFLVWSQVYKSIKASKHQRGPRGEWNAESVPLGGGGISHFGELGVGYSTKNKMSEKNIWVVVVW
jgi:hypothetical protein